MKKMCFILASTENRDYLLKRCVEAINSNALYKDADLYLYWQGKEDKIPHKERFTDIFVSDKLMGIFAPRYYLFKTYGVQYKYTVLIDDDLFMYPDTSYESAMSFLSVIDNNGVCNLGRQFHKRRNTVFMINYSTDDYNVEGGIVFPNKCVNVLVDYFKDTPVEVTEDIFWILLYVKGFDLYRDFSSNAIHTCHRPASDGSESGYYKWRLERPHVPLLPEYTTQRLVKDYFGDKMRYKVPEPRDVNEAGLEERAKCRKEMGLQ